MHTKIRTSRLVQAHDVRATPRRSTKDDLHLLTTGETAHGVVRDELGLETKVGKVLLNLTTNERTKETETLSFPGVDFDNLLLETTLNEVISWKPDVLRR